MNERGQGAVGLILLWIVLAIALIIILAPLFQQGGAVYEILNTQAEVAKFQATVTALKAFPTATPTPLPTPTPTPIPPINEAVGVGWMFGGCISAAVFLVITTLIGLEVRGLLRRNRRTVAKSPTGDVVYDLGHGELAVTRNSLSDRITPQPNLADDLLSKVDRARQYARTGHVPDLPDRRPAKSQNDGVDPQLLAAMSVEKTRHESFAAGMQNTLPEEDRLKRILAMKLTGRFKDKDKEPEKLSGRPWNVLPRPEQIPVALPGAKVGLLEAAQLEYLEANQPTTVNYERVHDE